MPPRGRGRGSRARKAAAVEPEKNKEPEEVQSVEQSGNAEEKIPDIPSVGGDIQQADAHRSPTQSSEKSEDVEIDIEHVEKDSDSDENPLLPSPARADPSQKCPEISKDKSKERRDYRKAMKNDPQIEKDLVEFYKTNPCLWDLRQEDHHNKDLKKTLLENISKSTGVEVIDIIGWWKGVRDTYTRLSQKKSGEERDDLPYKQKWLLENLAFLRERPIQRRAPIKSLQALADDNIGDLDAVEKLAAKQGKANDGSTLKGKGKSSKERGESEEDAHILVLQQTAKDSVSVLESLKDSIDKVAAKRDRPSDRATLYGQYLIQEMRQMSRRRFKLFRKEVEASLAKYSSSTDSEDDDFKPVPKKPCTDTTNATFSSMTSHSYGDSSSYYPSATQASGCDGWQPPPSRWIPNPPQATSIWHSQDNRYMQQYVQQQRMPAFQKQTSPMQQTFKQYPLRHAMRPVTYGLPAHSQDDLSQSYVRSLFASPITPVAPLTPVTNVASPLTRALVASGIDVSTLQDNFIPESVMSVHVLGQEGSSMDSSNDGNVRPLSVPVLTSASDVTSSSRVSQ